VEPGGTARRSCAGRWCKRVGLGLGGYLLVGNLMLLGASAALQVAGPEGERPVEAAGIDHLRVVDERLWRGGAPTQEGYEALAANGVTTIVDLRAAATPAELDAPRQLGFEVFHLPVHDGQTPSSSLVQRLVDIVDNSEGRVFIHCQAGVGRTGSMSAAYQVWMGENSTAGALVENMSIGPPTLEQVAFTLGLESGKADEPPIPVVVASRVLDAPRQLWNTIFG
jgi:protein tyrosine phosphatase (PTP) superfamily phosphohydrolase (DUF442 family)